MKNLTVTALLFLLFFTVCTAQTPCPTGKEGNIWYFGGSTFFDDPPPRPSSAMGK